MINTAGSPPGPVSAQDYYRDYSADNVSHNHSDSSHKYHLIFIF